MTVSAALLVKDPPIDRLAALVEYLRPVVSQFVIVVDDRTAADAVDIMSAWPNVETHTFGWVDDFSAGRNAALPHIPAGNWVLHVDPDELPSAAMLDFIRMVDAADQRDVVWQGSVYRAPRGYLFFTKNFFGGVQGPEWEEHWHCRLFRSDPRNYWYRPVHELVALDGQPESDTRGSAVLPKAPLGAALIHAKPADRTADDELYAKLAAAR